MLHAGSACAPLSKHTPVLLMFVSFMFDSRISFTFVLHVGLLVCGAYLQDYLSFAERTVYWPHCCAVTLLIHCGN